MIRQPMNYMIINRRTTIATIIVIIIAIIIINTYKGVHRMCVVVCWSYDTSKTVEHVVKRTDFCRPLRSTCHSVDIQRKIRNTIAHTVSYINAIPLLLNRFILDWITATLFCLFSTTQTKRFQIVLNSAAVPFINHQNSWISLYRIY